MEPNLKAVKAIFLDIDGVMTDGCVLIAEDGGPLRIFNEKDGHGLRMAAMTDLILGVVTGGSTQSLLVRMQAYGVPKDNIYLKCRDKLATMHSICERFDLQPSEILYMGDDIPDVAALRFAGVGVAPADAVEEAKKASDIVSPISGGRGFVRWTLELVMKAQGKWIFDVKKYAKMF